VGPPNRKPGRYGDASAAVQEITGEPLPESFRVRVLERAGYDVTLVLPDPAEAGELVDDELEQVAGGTAVVITGLPMSGYTRPSK
jgi:hypothetical protein